MEQVVEAIQARLGIEISFDPAEFERLKVEGYNAAEGVPGMTVDQKPNVWDACYDCPICKNKGYVAYLRDGRYAERPCECQSIRRARISAQRSGMTGYLDKTLRGFETDTPWRKDLRDLAVQYLQDGGIGWFGVLGQSGCGKTHVCAAICNELMRREKRVLYFQWLTDGRKLIAQRFDEAAYEQAFRPMVEAEVLYIDDFFKTQGDKLTPTEIKTGLELINHRYNSGKVTILSSELLLEELQGIDEATAGRIAERCGRYLKQIGRAPGRNYRIRGDEVD